MSIDNMIQGKGTAGAVFEISLNIVGSCLGGAVGAYAFSTLPMASGALIGLAGIVSSLVTAFFVVYFCPNWLSSKNLKHLCRVVKYSTMGTMLGQGYGVTSFGAQFGIMMSAYFASVITVIGAAYSSAKYLSNLQTQAAT